MNIYEDKDNWYFESGGYTARIHKKNTATFDEAEKHALQLLQAQLDSEKKDAKA